MTDPLKLAEQFEMAACGVFPDGELIGPDKFPVIAAALRLAFADGDVSDAENDCALAFPGPKGLRLRNDRINAARRARSEAFAAFRAAVSA